MKKLILLRHGESMWNKKNLFTGWVDVPLSSKGIEEALKAGEIINHLPIDAVYCSSLIRAIMTAMLAMSTYSKVKIPVIMHSTGRLKEWSEIHSKEEKKNIIPVYCSDALNERMYGDLQGLNKHDMKEKFGSEQVHIWRRSYDVPPPNGECLGMTTKRTVPYFKKTIVPELENGKNIFISAHGNSLRSIIKYIDNISDEQIVHLNIPTGIPIIYDFKNGKFTKEEGSII